MCSFQPTSPAPVLVWIHGGGYAIGGGSSPVYDPIPLVALSDIIVVNVNYRLGFFGFMTTGNNKLLELRTVIKGNKKKPCIKLVLL